MSLHGMARTLYAIKCGVKNEGKYQNKKNKIVGITQSKLPIRSEHRYPGRESSAQGDVKPLTGINALQGGVIGQ